jgi:hypothetical protein
VSLIKEDKSCGGKVIDFELFPSSKIYSETDEENNFFCGKGR